MIEAYNLFNDNTDISSLQLLPAVEATIEKWVNLYKEIIENKDNWHIDNNSHELDEEHSSYYNSVESHYLNKLPEILQNYERLKTLVQ